MIYTAKVSATATGGVQPYESFQWSGKPSGATATYLYPLIPVTGKEETVTVTDDDGNEDDDTATIERPVSGQGGRDGTASFEVPLGGEIYLIWGGAGDVTARSANTGVATVSVSSPGIRVSGVSAGETNIVVTTDDDGELYLPIVVR